MIINFLVSLFTSVAGWVGTLVPSFDLPSWFTSFGSTFNGFFQQFDGFGVWANWTLIASILGGVLTFWGVVLSIKILRWIWGLTPFSGGS